jgi:hypothetical protein
VAHWATLLLGFGAGVLATLVTIVHQRGAEMRTRQIGAADEYLSESIRSGQAARDLRQALSSSPPAPAERLDELGRSLEEVSDRLLEVVARIVLLFGADSTTWRYCQITYGTHARIVDALKDWRAQGPQFDQRRLKVLRAEWPDTAVDDFALAARREVRFGMVARFYARLTRPATPASGEAETPEPP